MGCTDKEANNPKEFTCILPKSSLIRLENGCGFPFSPLILTLRVTDWKRKNRLFSPLSSSISLVRMMPSVYLHS